MYSPTTKLHKIRRRVTPSSTPTDEISVAVQPTPPPGKRPSSSSSRSSSRPGSVTSIGSLPDMHNNVLCRQNSHLAPLAHELVDGTKGATTIGRHHTIVPPINRQPITSGMTRPISRSYSLMAETPINLTTSDEFTHDDEHAINSVSEENDPSGPLRLHNPLIKPIYIETPTADTTYLEGQEARCTTESPSLSNSNNNNVTEQSQHLPTIPSEPEEGKPRLKLAVKLPNGLRVEQYFSPTDELQTVVDLGSIQMGSVLVGYTLRSTDCKYTNLTTTLQQSQIRDRTLLFLEPPES